MGAFQHRGRLRAEEVRYASDLVTHHRGLRQLELHGVGGGTVPLLGPAEVSMGERPADLPPSSTVPGCCRLHEWLHASPEASRKSRLSAPIDSVRIMQLIDGVRSWFQPQTAMRGDQAERSRLLAWQRTRSQCERGLSLLTPSSAKR